MAQWPTRYTLDLKKSRDITAIRFLLWDGLGTKDGKIGWKLNDGVLEIVPGTGSIITKDPVRDFRLHLEFNINDTAGATGEAAGNSGVYIQRRYEVQILNSYGKKELVYGDCGSLYKTTVPRVNASRPTGEWQTYDIIFRAPRWNGSKKIQNARLTVVSCTR